MSKTIDVYEKYEQLRAKQEIANNPAKVEKAHAKGKCTAEERLAMLFDNGEYQKTNPWARNSCLLMDFYLANADMRIRSYDFYKTLN